MKPPTHNCLENTEVYNILCDSLGLEPSPNNGTLRLPLKTVGFHTPDTKPEEPSDPVPVSMPTPPTPPSTPLPPSPPSPVSVGVDEVISISPIEASSAADPNEVPPHMIGVNPTDDTSVERPVVPDESGMTDDEKNFWEWFKDKIDKAKGWLSGLTGSKDTPDAEKEGGK
jgi:hypothetical protein